MPGSEARQAISCELASDRSLATRHPHTATAELAHERSGWNHLFWSPDTRAQLNFAGEHELQRDRRRGAGIDVGPDSPSSVTAGVAIGGNGHPAATVHPTDNGAQHFVAERLPDRHWQWKAANERE